MNELNLPIREPAAGSGRNDLFDHLSSDQNEPLVTISSGPHLEQLPLNRHTTVGTLRARFRQRLDIAPHSQALLDGRDVDDETIVRPGQALMFSRKAGEKGAGAATPRAN